MTHREACVELLRNARRFKAGRISRDEWYQRVAAVFAQRFPSAPSRPPAPPGARP